MSAYKTANILYIGFFLQSLASALDYFGGLKALCENVISQMVL
jgi:hypothetical protein